MADEITWRLTFRHHASYIYRGQAYHYSPEYTFYILSQQIYLIIFLDFLSPSSLIPPQNVVYFLMLPFLVHKIFTFYINVVLNYKCAAPGPKCYRVKSCLRHLACLYFSFRCLKYRGPRYFCRYSDLLRDGGSRDRFPVGGEVFHTRPDRLWGRLILL